MLTFQGSPLILRATYSLALTNLLQLYIGNISHFSPEEFYAAHSQLLHSFLPHCFLALTWKPPYHRSWTCNEIVALFKSDLLIESKCLLEVWIVKQLDNGFPCRHSLLIMMEADSLLWEKFTYFFGYPDVIEEVLNLRFLSAPRKSFNSNIARLGIPPGSYRLNVRHRLSHELAFAFSTSFSLMLLHLLIREETLFSSKCPLISMLRLDDSWRLLALLVILGWIHKGVSILDETIDDSDHILNLYSDSRPFLLDRLETKQFQHFSHLSVFTLD